MKLLNKTATLKTALVVSAVFLWSVNTQAQVQVIDASIDSGVTAQTAPRDNISPADDNPASAQAQNEVFYQLQLLQQEVMQLRGLVEEQAYTIKQLKDQSLERYIDLDRRIGQVAKNPSAAVSSDQVATPNARGANVVVAQEGEKQVYDAAYSLVVSKRFYEALEAFKQFLIDFPGGKYAPNSYYWMGELYQVVKPQDLEASRQAFTQLLNLHPDHSKAPDAMYKLGKVYYLKGNKEKSRQWLDKVVVKGVNPAADKARQFINENF